MRKCENCKYYTGIQCHGHGEFWGNCTLINNLQSELDPKYKNSSVWASVTSGECKILKNMQVRTINMEEKIIKEIRNCFSYFDIQCIIHALENFDTKKEICNSIVETRRIALIEFYKKVITKDYSTYNKEKKNEHK